MFSGRYKELWYQYELIRSLLVIRNHYLKTAVNEVYDNIGQVLSLINVELSNLDFESVKKSSNQIPSLRKQARKAINDLRHMTRLFYPENLIAPPAKFTHLIEQEVKYLSPHVAWVTDKKSIARPVIAKEKGLLLFGILLEIFTLIDNKQKGGASSVILRYYHHKVDVTIILGRGPNPIEIKAIMFGSLKMSILERIQLFGGNYQVGKTEQGLIRNKFMLPIN